MQKLTDWLWVSGLPKARDIAQARPATVIDVTRRHRPVVERACLKHGVVYVKCPVSYACLHSEIDAAVQAVLTAAPPVLVHCFHGRDRSPMVCRIAIMRCAGAVYLHGVGRNLSRAYRACAAAGIPALHLHQCTGKVDRALYSDAGRVDVQPVDSLPEPSDDTIWLETWGKRDFQSVNWLRVRRIVIGGETAGLPRGREAYRIPQANTLGYTVEAALTLALHEWGRWK
jgi:hypothetical protein